MFMKIYIHDRNVHRNINVPFLACLVIRRRSHGWVWHATTFIKKQQPWSYKADPLKSRESLPLVSVGDRPHQASYTVRTRWQTAFHVMVPPQQNWHPQRQIVNQLLDMPRSAARCKHPHYWNPLFFSLSFFLSFPPSNTRLHKLGDWKKLFECTYGPLFQNGGPLLISSIDVDFSTRVFCSLPRVWQVVALAYWGW